MCFASGLIGALAFLQRRSLVGEALSHAAYPGVVISVVVAASFFPYSEEGLSASIILGATLFSALGLLVMNALQRRLRVSSDAALCFVLSIFFGLGVLIASRIQVTHALWFRQIQVYLFGQTATMLDSHIYLYGALAVSVLLTVIFLFRVLEVLHFDPEYASASGVPTLRVQMLVNLLLILAIVVGMRSVGVVLMSAMLIAPAVAARPFSSSFGPFLAFSGVFGMLSAFFGNFFSVKIPLWIDAPTLPLSTGPMIALMATFFAFFSLLFAPKRGVVTRMVRIAKFRARCQEENILKALYKGWSVSPTAFQCFRMERKGWLEGESLTKKGRQRAEKLIRLHRLWEVYLVHMGQGKERVHHSAEEMEHILTPDIERELLTLLDDPKTDPHAQPIPRGTS